MNWIFIGFERGSAVAISGSTEPMAPFWGHLPATVPLPKNTPSGAVEAHCPDSLVVSCRDRSVERLSQAQAAWCLPSSKQTVKCMSCKNPSACSPVRSVRMAGDAAFQMLTMARRYPDYLRYYRSSLHALGYVYIEQLLLIGTFLTTLSDVVEEVVMHIKGTRTR